MVHLIHDINNNPIGWKLLPTTDKEREIAAIIRDLQFFGFDNGIPEKNTNIEYNGIELIDDSKGKVLDNLKSVSWIQAKHQAK